MTGLVLYVCLHIVTALHCFLATVNLWLPSFHPLDPSSSFTAPFQPMVPDRHPGPVAPRQPLHWQDVWQQCRSLVVRERILCVVVMLPTRMSAEVLHPSLEFSGER